MILSQKSAYISAVKFNGKIMIYENVPKLNRVMVRDGNQALVVLKNSRACHNFSVFEHNGLLYAIAGQDTWKNDRNLFTMTKHEEFIAYYEKRFYRPFDRDTAYIDRVLKWVKAHKAPLRHSDGLYLFESVDGYGWKQVYDHPVITVANEGFLSCLHWKSGEFDGHVFCQYRNGNFYIFLRANIDRGKRYVQYASSPDMRTWSKFNLLPIDYDDKINTYFMVGGEYQGKVVCFLPQFDSVKCWIDVFLTDDFEKYEYVRRILKKTAPRFTGKPKNADHPVRGIIGNQYFIHHNYMGEDSTVEAYDLNAIF